VIIAVAGGKGGTGKTTLAVSLALLASGEHKVLLGDIDVDNPCTFTLLDISLKTLRTIFAYKPVIEEEKCSFCGTCSFYCPAHALVVIPGKKVIFMETLCEGCSLCEVVCPNGAIREGKETIGYLKFGEKGYLHLIVGELKPGSRRYHEVAGETLAHILSISEKYDYIVVDCPPGTGASVAEALKVSDIVVAVTEPTRLGVHDLIKFKKLVERCGKKLVIVVNKYGISGGCYRELEKVAGNEFFKIPYDRYLVEAYSTGRSVVEMYPESPSAKALRDLWQWLRSL